MDSNLWCAVYTSDEEGYMCNSGHLGMLINPSGSCLDWDRETYPYLCQLDNSDTARWDMAEDEKKMQTHFISLLSYLRDYPQIVKILNGNEELPYDTMIESVKKDGLRIYGFSMICQKEKLLQLRDDGEAQQERNAQHHDAHVGGSVENLDDEGFRAESGRDSRATYLRGNQAVPCPHAHDPIMGWH